MSAWHLIETAPDVAWGMTPVSVILYGRSFGVHTGRAAKNPDGTVHADVAWISGNIAGSDVTHWMPLPDPPDPSTTEAP